MPEALGKPRHRPLRGAVQAARRVLSAGHAADQHDPATALAERREARLDGERDAENVRQHHRPPRFRIAARDVARGADARIRNHDVDPSEALARSGDCRLRLVPVGRVRHAAGEATAISEKAAKPVLVTPRYECVVAGCRSTQRNRSANASRAAGDEE
jgi:hypothetical protein